MPTPSPFCPYLPSTTTAFGYIDLGVTTQDLPLTEVYARIDEWKATGAQGIFLDDFGYDYGTTRDRSQCRRDLRP